MYAFVGESGVAPDLSASSYNFYLWTFPAAFLLLKLLAKIEYFAFELGIGKLSNSNIVFPIPNSKYYIDFQDSPLMYCSQSLKLKARHFFHYSAIIA